MRLTSILALAAAGAIAMPAAAQTVLDVDSLREINDAELVTADGQRVGEIEDVLVDQAGNPVAITVEIREGFLNLDEDEVVFALDQLTWQDGDYVTSFGASEIEGLPRYDD